MVRRGREVVLIHREPEHNLGSAAEDRAFLEAVAAELVAAGAAVTVLEAPPRERSSVPLVLSMCRSMACCAALRQFFPEALLVNAPEAVIRTRRDFLYPHLAATVGLFPPAREHGFGAGLPDLPFPFWMKRHGYHHLHPGDVRLVSTPEEYAAGVSHFRSGGEERVFLQEHRAGEKIKFYAVRDPDTEELLFLHLRHPQARRYRAAVEEFIIRALPGLGLAVCGGDLLAAPGGRLYPVDVNAWPSFADCQSEGAKVIASWSLARAGRT